MSVFPGVPVLNSLSLSGTPHFPIGGTPISSDLVIRFRGRPYILKLSPRPRLSRRGDRTVGYSTWQHHTGAANLRRSELHNNANQLTCMVLGGCSDTYRFYG